MSFKSFSKSIWMIGMLMELMGMMMSNTEQRVDDVAAKFGGISVITTIGVLQMSSQYGWVASLQQKLWMKIVVFQPD